MKKIMDDDGLYIQYQNDNGQLHCLDGPAVINDLFENPLGPIREYWINGKIHRLDGPAVVYLNYPQDNMWFYKGKHMLCNSQKEFEKLIKMKAFW